MDKACPFVFLFNIQISISERLCLNCVGNKIGFQLCLAETLVFVAPPIIQRCSIAKSIYDLIY